LKQPPSTRHQPFPGAPTGDTQDYDGDGVPNIFEYATFGNPVDPTGLDARW
jgi:hypothetical protein